jgi:hypothetical protein
MSKRQLGKGRHFTAPKSLAAGQATPAGRSNTRKTLKTD